MSLKVYDRNHTRRDYVDSGCAGTEDKVRSKKPFYETGFRLGDAMEMRSNRAKFMSFDRCFKRGTSPNLGRLSGLPPQSVRRVVRLGPEMHFAAHCVGGNCVAGLGAVRGDRQDLDGRDFARGDGASVSWARLGMKSLVSASILIAEGLRCSKVREHLTEPETEVLWTYCPTHFRHIEAFDECDLHREEPERERFADQTEQPDKAGDPSALVIQERHAGTMSHLKLRQSVGQPPEPIQVGTLAIRRNGSTAADCPREAMNHHQENHWCHERDQKQPVRQNWGQILAQGSEAELVRLLKRKMEWYQDFLPAGTQVSIWRSCRRPLPQPTHRESAAILSAGWTRGSNGQAQMPPKNSSTKQPNTQTAGVSDPYLGLHGFRFPKRRREYEHSHSTSADKSINSTGVAVRRMPPFCRGRYPGSARASAPGVVCEAGV